MNKFSIGSDKGLSYKHFNNSDELPGRVFAIVKINNSPLFITENGIYTFNKLKKEFDKAIESYDKATEVDPEFANAWFFKGIAYFDKKDYNNAEINSA